MRLQFECYHNKRLYVFSSGRSYGTRTGATPPATALRVRRAFLVPVTLRLRLGRVTPLGAQAAVRPAITLVTAVPGALAFRPSRAVLHGVRRPRVCAVAGTVVPFRCADRRGLVGLPPPLVRAAATGPGRRRGPRSIPLSSTRPPPLARPSPGRSSFSRSVCAEDPPICRCRRTRSHWTKATTNSTTISARTHTQ